LHNGNILNNGAKGTSNQFLDACMLLVSSIVFLLNLVDCPPFSNILAPSLPETINKMVFVLGLLETMDDHNITTSIVDIIVQVSLHFARFHIF
jgi:hypothetical protein